MTTSTGSLATIEPVSRVVAPPRVEPPAEVAEPLETEIFVGPPAPDGSEVVGVAQASVTQWDDEDYRWISFQVETDEPTWMRWRDPSGGYPIEAMPCAFPTEDGHECRAGRSHWRLAQALRDGARPGTWTIEACVGDVCEPVDTVEIGVR